MLCILFWGSTFFYISVSDHQKSSATRFGGIAPTIAIVTTIYAILSLSVMVIDALISGNDNISSIHWILQIVIFTVTAILIIFLSISRVAATSGLAFNKAKTPTPKDLHDLLASYESSLRSPSSNTLKASIKQLRDTLFYSINESSSLANLFDYQELCREIKALCASFARLQNSNEENITQLNSLSESTIALTTKTRLISEKLVKR